MALLTRPPELYSLQELKALKAAVAILGRPAYGPGPTGDRMLLSGHPGLSGRGAAFDALKTHLKAQDPEA